MHYRLLVLTKKENAEDSEGARSYVYNELLNDSSFCGEGGRFSSPFADWFVIGGRWSGELTRLLLDQTKLKKFWADFDEQKLGWTNNSDKLEADQKRKSEELFVKYFPTWKGKKDLPVWRDNYEHNGFDDDAQIVTKKLWEVIEAKYKEVEEHDGKGIPEFELNPDKDGIINLEEAYEGEATNAKNVIGKYWVVVVDYHN